MNAELQKLWKTEDYWAVWLGLGIVFLALAAFWSGSTIASWAVTPGSWSDFSAFGADLAKQLGGYVTIFLLFGAVFTVSVAIMGRNLREFVLGYVILFLASLAVFYLAGWSVVKKAHLGAPLLKKLRSWAFVLCFLCIGLSTRFKDLLTFGMKPFWAFTIGVAVNVPLGYFLSTVVFSKYWSNISKMM